MMMISTLSLNLDLTDSIYHFCSMDREMQSSINLVYSFLFLIQMLSRHSLPLDYSAEINRDSKSWIGRARIPTSYFPPDVSLFNAYAIHGTGEERM